MSSTKTFVSGDYVTIKSIHVYAGKMAVIPKALYSAIAARFRAAGFDKHEGQDGEFKNSTGVFGLYGNTQTFDANPAINSGSVFFEAGSSLSVEEILFHGAPDWAVDMRKVNQYYCWTDGKQVYQNFDYMTNSRTRQDLDGFKIIAVKSTPKSGWYDYTEQDTIAPAPIGTEVEGYKINSWVRGTVIAHDENRAVLKVDEGYHSYLFENLRPLDWEPIDPKQEWIDGVIKSGVWQWPEALDDLYEALTTGLIPVPESVDAE